MDPKPITSPVALDDVVEQLGEAITMAPGHPLRRVRCLACAMMIGGRPFRTYTIIDFRHDACACGAIACATYFVCAEHGTSDNGTLMVLALARGRHIHGPRS
jgi:hypothetical protein